MLIPLSDLIENLDTVTNAFFMLVEARHMRSKQSIGLGLPACGEVLGCVRLDGSRWSNIIEVSQCRDDVHVLRASQSFSCDANEAVREAKVKLISRLDHCDIFICELQTQSLNVGLEMLDLATTNNGEQVRGLRRFVVRH